MKKLSIIIPSNDNIELVKEYLPQILSLTEDDSASEFIFVNAHKDPNIESYVRSLKEVIYIFSSIAKRSVQMNLGASSATGDRLFFLHLDSVPPKGYDGFINSAFNQGARSGCFRLKFDMNHWVLRSSEWFTQFSLALFRGGDQGLFLYRQEFDVLGGFREDWAIFEDIDLSRKLINAGSFKVLPYPMLTSARKYQRIGPLKLQVLFGILTLAYWIGVSNQRLWNFYRNNISANL